MLNAKNRGRRDGVPTGIRILFATNNGVTQASQLQLIQQTRGLQRRVLPKRPDARPE